MTLEEEVKSQLPKVFELTLSQRLAMQKLTIADDVKGSIKRAMEEMFKNNPRKISSAFKNLDIGRCKYFDVLFSLATALTNLIVVSATYEGRSEVFFSDFLMALIDFRKYLIWPWE